jgi:CDP-diacylglycerol---glycerol-3-phosphate 3-phosphatidyltransferase
MISKLIGRLFSTARDAVAGGLLRVGLHPNILTVLGMLLMIGAGVAIASGRDHWHTWALGLLFVAGACDLLDGALAKRGGLESRFGGILDSVCDRLSDAALYLGPAAYFIVQPDSPTPGGCRPNLTLAALAALGLVWAYLTSYIKVRAAAAGAAGDGGFWQRPERIVTLLLGVTFHHMVIALWILGLWPLTTVAHRLWRAWRTTHRQGGGAGESLQPRGVWAVLLWRWPRGTAPFDIHAALVIVMVVAWEVPDADLLRNLLGL